MTDSNVEHFLDSEGRVNRWPKKQADKEMVLSYLANKFQFDKSYHEQEVNEILKQWHTFTDWPLLRRELFERGFVNRNLTGTNYTRIK